MAHETDHDHHHQQAYGYAADFSSSHSSSFETSHGLFELQAGMEMLGMPSNSKHYFPKPEASSSDASGIISPAANSWQQHHQQHNRLLVDDPSLRCLFPSQTNQGLSQSLPYQQQQQMRMMDARFYHQAYNLKNSIYMIPAQELLNEFCNLGGTGNSPRKQKSRTQDQAEASSSSPTWNQSALFSMDILELQKRKARLLSMLEEVDRRYKRYCDQMLTVVSSFEAVAGQGSATVYSALASKAMSRHFRCLRDGIVSQIHATKKAMGEKDPVVPGTTKGETPRLKLVDQCIRQHKSFQHAGGMESHPWRPQRGLPERSVSILRAWLFEHFLHPYPSDVDKHILARQTGLSRSQVSNWFINARVRLWKPMVEEMYLEETKEQDNIHQSSQGTATAEFESNENNSRPNSLLQPNRNTNPSSSNHHLDQKPFSAGQLHMDSDSLTSIFNNRPDRRQQVPRAENFGVVELDFSSYNECSSNQNFGNGVSLTLGLQQHSGEGMSLPFSPTSQQSIFFSREQMEDCEPVQFSILDGEGQNLPYRNLMGAQLLHDLTG